MPIVDALLPAGGQPGPGEPLYPLTQGRPKALLALAGRPMGQWVLDALQGAAAIRRVIVIGLDAGAGLTAAKLYGYVPAAGTLLDNLLTGARWALAQPGPPPTHFLAVSSDIPLITPAMVDWSVNAALETDHDAYYSIIAQAVMERRFPDSRRTYFNLKEGRFTAGDMNLIKASLLDGYNPVWPRIFEARKSLLRQAALIGPEAFLRLALGQLSLSWGERRLQERLGLRGHVLVCPHAEAGMDVDKPRQYELARRELEPPRG